MIKVYTGIKGFIVSLFLIAAAISIFSIFFWGIGKAIQLLLPIVMVLSYGLILGFLLGILPASFSKPLRPKFAVYTILISQALGVSAWMVAFFYIIKTFGLAMVFFAFLFQFLAPIAIVGAILKGAWPMAAHLSIWVAFSYGMRFYSQWLLNEHPRHQEKNRVIDVDVVEVRSQPM